MGVETSHGALAFTFTFGQAACDNPKNTHLHQCVHLHGRVCLELRLEVCFQRIQHGPQVLDLSPERRHLPPVQLLGDGDGRDKVDGWVGG